MDTKILQADAISSPSVAPARPALPRWQRQACVVGLILLFGYYVVYHWHHESKDNGGHLGDFRTFYQAAQFARTHRDIYLAGPNPAQMYVYPPLIAFVFTPLTVMPVLPAAHVFLVLNALMLLASVLLATSAMLRRLGDDPARMLLPAALLTALLSENEMRAVLTMLETDPIMLLMFTLGLWWLDRRPLLAGAALGFALNIKYLTIVAVPYFILRRRWKALMGFVGGAIFFALAPALMLGWQENLRCLRVSTAGLLRWFGVPPEVSHGIKVHNIADDLSVSITSAFARVLGPHGFGNPLIMALATALGLATVALVARMYHRNGFSIWRWPNAVAQRLQPFKALVGMEWAGLVTVALVFSPDTNTRHLVLAVLVNALAAALLFLPRPGVSRRPVLAGTLLILVGFIMPFGEKGSATHLFYFTYSIPCWCLLAGYLLILHAGLQQIASQRGGSDIP